MYRDLYYGAISTRQETKISFYIVSILLLNQMNEKVSKLKYLAAPQNL